jgi:hypothetical protein
MIGLEVNDTTANDPPEAPMLRLPSGLRTDLVLAKGRLALLNTGATPQEAMLEDLLFVRSVLDAAGIDFLLVRGNDNRPLLAIDWRDRKAFRAVLARACVDEPFYAKPANGSGGPTVLLADGKLAADPRVPCATGPAPASGWNCGRRPPRRSTRRTRTR